VGNFTLTPAGSAVDMRFGRILDVNSCFHTLSTTASRNTAVTTHNMAATPGHSRCGYYAVIHTFHTRSCSSRSYYFDDSPDFGSSRIAGLIHNSSRCCNLTIGHCRHTTTALAAATADCILQAADHSIIDELQPLTTEVTQ
jgi:hypothetical protein